MKGYDYSIQYARFHDDSEAHARDMERHLATVLGSRLPEDRSAAILDIGCGFGFALRTLRALGYHDLRFTIEGDMGHDVWARVYAGNDVYDWLLSHQKRSAQ